MDKDLYKILKMLKKHTKLNYYQFKMDIFFSDYQDYCLKMFYLLENDYIYFDSSFPAKYEFEKTDEAHGLIPQELYFYLTNTGKNKIAQLEEDRRRFKINSVLVPIIVSIITSILTVYLIRCLASSHITSSKNSSNS